MRNGGCYNFLSTGSTVMKRIQKIEKDEVKVKKCAPFGLLQR